MFLAAPAAGACVDGRTVHAPFSSGTALTLSALPTVGDAPLLVQFNASYPNGTPPAVSWSFGDGQFLNGSALTDSSPAHQYTTPGRFLAELTATWSSGSVNATVWITVRSSALQASATCWPSGGPAPLTVDLNASVRGGTGTYVAYTWSFGDGSQGSGLAVRYTYRSAGEYFANFTVLDADGVSQTAQVQVNVSLPSGGPSGPTGGPSSGSVSDWLARIVVTPAFDIALAGIAVLAAVSTFLVWRRRSRRGWKVDPLDPGDRPGTRSALALEAEAGDLETPPERTRLAAGLPVEAGPPRPQGRAAPSAEVVGARLALRVVAYLGSLPRAEGAAGVAATQVGIARAVGARQSSVSRVLARLVASGIATSQVEHIPNASRRMRVYRLTPRGDRLARAVAYAAPEAPQG